MGNESTSVVAFRRAVALVGTQVAFARLIGVSQQAVSKRLKAGIPLQPEYVLKVEAATGVSRYELRPDIYQRDEHPTPTDHHLGARA